MSDETIERRPALPPVAYPLLGLVFGAILVLAFSRILLAVDKITAAAIALFAALNILVGAALVAYGRRVRRRPVSFPLIVGAGVVVVALGGLAMGIEAPQHGGEAAHGGGAEAERVDIAAKDIEFDTEELTLPAGAKVELAFNNQDALQHNVAVFSDEAKTEVVFRGEIFTGPKTMTYSFTAPREAGTYFFHCDVHPQMEGTIEVTEGGAEGGAEGGGGGGEGEQVAAKNIAFQPTEVAVPAGGEVSIAFDNQDQGVQHNITVFDGESADAPVLFDGALISGPATEEYRFQAPKPGRYFFHCKVHPNMTGTLVVE